MSYRPFNPGLPVCPDLSSFETAFAKPEILAEETLAQLGAEAAPEYIPGVITAAAVAEARESDNPKVVAAAKDVGVPLSEAPIRRRLIPREDPLPMPATTLRDQIRVATGRIRRMGVKPRPGQTQAETSDRGRDHILPLDELSGSTEPDTPKSARRRALEALGVIASASVAAAMAIGSVMVPSGPEHSSREAYDLAFADLASQDVLKPEVLRKIGLCAPEIAAQIALDTALPGHPLEVRQLSIQPEILASAQEVAARHDIPCEAAVGTRGVYTEQIDGTSVPLSAESISIFSVGTVCLDLAAAKGLRDQGNPASTTKLFEKVESLRKDLAESQNVTCE